jgi:hypothetical protein
MEVHDVQDKVRMSSFARTLLSSMGECCSYNMTHDQHSDLARIKMIMEQVNDVHSFAGERLNASRLPQFCFQKLEWSDDGLRAACGTISGSDAAKPARATQQFI